MRNFPLLVAAGQNLCTQVGDIPRQQVETIDPSHANYAIEMGGKIAIHITNSRNGTSDSVTLPLAVVGK